MNRPQRARLAAMRQREPRVAMEIETAEAAGTSASPMSLMSDDVDDAPSTYEEARCASFAAFAAIRADAKLCDVRIICGDVTFCAHKIVLCGTVPYFRAMFTGDLRESRLDEVTIGEAEGVNAVTLGELIEFAYTGRARVTADNVQSLMMGAAFLLLDGIVHACGLFLQRRLQTCNVLAMRQFGISVNSESLVTACNRYIHKHFVPLSVHSVEFVALDKDDVLDILRRGQLHVASEEHVFHAAMRWIGDDKERLQHCAAVLKVVRLPLLSPTFLADHVATDPRLRGDIECRDLIDEAKNYHLLPERRAQMNTFTTTPRSCDDIAGIVYAVGGLSMAGDSQSTVEMYNPVTRRWSVIEPMSTLRSRVGVTVKDGLLYAIGGFNGYERLKTVEVFDTVARQWHEVAPLRNKRSALGACVVDGCVWVCGGYDGITSLSTVEAYDTLANTWTMQAPMSSQRSAAGIATIDGVIYVIGGHDGTSIFTSVERYDTSTREWTSVCPMNSRRCRLGAVTLDGKIYACGGYDGTAFLSSVELYDPATDTWSYLEVSLALTIRVTILQPMAVKRSRVSLVANCGKLYAIGGFDGNANLASMEMYDISKNVWSFGTPMSVHEGGVGIGVIPEMNALDYQ